MNFEKRLEDARARRQIVLEQKDRTARAAKAAAKRAPELADRPMQISGDAQAIPRARPAGTNARALEAALRKRDSAPPPSPDTTVEPLPRPGKDDAPEVSEGTYDRVESPQPVAANEDVAYSGPPKERKPLSGSRIVFVALAVLAGFGIGIFAGPAVVARLQGPVAPPPTLFAQDQAPLPPGTARISVGDVSSLSGDVGRANAPAIRRAVPNGPILTAIDPALPIVSLAPEAASERVAGASTRISDARPQPRATQTALLISPADADRAFNSTAPRVGSISGTQVLALLNNSDELPSLPLALTAPGLPSVAPKTLSAVTGDTAAFVDTVQPPATEKLSPRLTGIGSLETYLVHVQWPGSLTRERLAEVETVIGDAGLPLGKLNRVGYKISSSQVRFFHRRDGVAAAALAERIGARSRDFTNYRPSPAVGTLEVFLSGSSNSRRTATQSRTQLGEQDREFIELRDRLIKSLRSGDHL